MKVRPRPPADAVRRDAVLAAARTLRANVVREPEGAVSLETEIGPIIAPEADPTMTAAIAERGHWEPGEVDFFRRTLRPGGLFVDVGANMGYHTVAAADIVGPSGAVLAFEPDPRSFEYLNANVWARGLANVAAFPIALGDRNGFARLERSEVNRGDHRLWSSESGLADPDDTEPRSSIPVPLGRLDDLGLVWGPLGGVKIDVQGLETEVLRGMRNVLAGSPDVVLSVEVWPYGLRSAGSSPGELLALCRELGFHLYEQHPWEVGLRPLDEADLVRRLGVGWVMHTNIALTRRPVRIVTS